MEAPPPPPPQEAPPPPAPEPPTGRQSDDSDVEMDGVEYDPNEEQAADDDEEFVPETTGMATRGEATKAPVAPQEGREQCRAKTAFSTIWPSW